MFAGVTAKNTEVNKKITLSLRWPRDAPNMSVP